MGLGLAQVIEVGSQALIGNRWTSTKSSKVTSLSYFLRGLHLSVFMPNRASYLLYFSFGIFDLSLILRSDIQHCSYPLLFSHFFDVEHFTPILIQLNQPNNLLLTRQSPFPPFPSCYIFIFVFASIFNPILNSPLPQSYSTYQTSMAASRLPRSTRRG